MQQLTLEEENVVKWEFLSRRHRKECSYFLEIFLKLDHTFPVILFLKGSSSLTSHQIDGIARSKVSVHMKIRGNNGASAALPSMTMDQYLAS